jgi:hypothetical protein
VVAWQRGNVRNGFLVQYAVDVADPATYSATIPCSKTKFKIAGERSSTIVHFRVAAIDTTSPTGMSPWSDWVGCTVR